MKSSATSSWNLRFGASCPKIPTQNLLCDSLAVLFRHNQAQKMSSDSKDQVAMKFLKMSLTNCVQSWSSFAIISIPSEVCIVDDPHIFLYWCAEVLFLIV